MKKVAITQDLCRMVELMLKGGAQQKEVGERLGISKATVSRIKTAGYDAEQYRKNTTERVEKENQTEATEEEKQIQGIRYPLTVEKVEMSEGGVSVTARQAEEQVPGQMKMELPPAEEQKPEMSDQTKLMRFQAGQADKIIGQMMVNVDALLMKLDRLNDTLSMILRKMDG